MNDKIISAILAIDQAFYPELKRIQEINDLKDIYNVKTYFSHVSKQIIDMTPIHTSTTLLNKIVLFNNKFVKNYGYNDMKLPIFATSVAKQRMTLNRTFDSLWGNLNIFSSYECSSIREAFEQLASQFQQLYDHFNNLGFPSIQEGLIIMNKLQSTLKDQLKLPSVQIYLMKLLQEMFLEEPMFCYDLADFFNQFNIYLSNKYPDGFDRIYTQLRSSYMITQNITYEKPLFYCSEHNYITNAAHFKLNNLLQTHFTSKPIEVPRDSMFAFHMIINYVINIYIEIQILTNQQTIEQGLLHMHNQVYNQNSECSTSSALEEHPEIYLSNSQLSIIQSLQEQQLSQIEQQQEQQIVENLIIEDQIQRPENSIDLNAVESMLQIPNLLNYAILARQKKLQLQLRKNTIHQQIQSFISNNLGREANLHKLEFQLNQILKKLSQEVNQTNQKSISDAELIEIFAGNLQQLGNIEGMKNIQTDRKSQKFGVVPPVHAIMRILTALQLRIKSVKEIEAPISFPLELEKIMIEIKIKQSSLQLSRTDAVFIVIRTYQEILDIIAIRNQLFTPFQLTLSSTPTQILSILQQRAKNTSGPFSSFFTENFTCLACGPLKRMLEKLVSLLAKAVFSGWKLTCSPLFAEKKALHLIEVSFQNEIVQQCEYQDIQEDQKYNYNNIDAIVEVTAPLVDHWIGNEEEEGISV
ncbi:hypothetical protein SS50377_24349 [Spironucleus salmonicida]|uniref:Uncharacterized protein n=1 Tax=Spironucleus salmonicida TaxID=348837 RepID=V6LZ39_9EUKA|nr:hypothetical protein SS50377_24349 [Spironucleus salmonicida]|eukprot:EST46099.1 Hypothetical protein SS50377_14093 [Spironucleus salmonicida]